MAPAGRQVAFVRMLVAMVFSLFGRAATAPCIAGVKVAANESACQCGDFGTCGQGERCTNLGCVGECELAGFEAPWTCHQYEKDQGNEWCAEVAEVGHHQGFEFSFHYKGAASTCGGCWCCKRPMKTAWTSVTYEQGQGDQWCAEVAELGHWGAHEYSFYYEGKNSPCSSNCCRRPLKTADRSCWCGQEACPAGGVCSLGRCLEPHVSLDVVGMVSTDADTVAAAVSAQTASPKDLARNPVLVMLLAALSVQLASFAALAVLARYRRVALPHQELLALHAGDCEDARAGPAQALVE